MKYPAYINNNQQKHQQRKRKGQLMSYWGGNFEWEEESDDLLATEATQLSNLVYPLSQVRAGYSVWITGFGQKGGIKKLLGMGLAPGMELKVISSQPSGSVIVAVQDQRMGLGAGMANKILVSDQPLNNINKQEKTMSTQSRNYLREMPVGTVGRILGYEVRLVANRSF